MKKWTQEKLIAVAKAFDTKAQNSKRVRYSEYRYKAYSARLYARKKQ